MLFSCLYTQDSHRKFMSAVKKDDIAKVSKWTDKGLDPNFIDLESGGGESDSHTVK